MSEGTTVGLRIDVDTMRGTRLGVPALLQILGEHNIDATFFFSVGPDNMGRHLWRLLRPAFLIKMLRSNAVGLYGLDILLRGTMWPGSVIGKHCAETIRSAADAGHETGVHAWDHHRWQTRVASMSKNHTVLPELQKAKNMLEDIVGTPVHCSAVPGWRCTDAVLLAKEQLEFSYNSDCRGSSIFVPEVAGQKLLQPQIPVTLPTYDEVIGRDGITDEKYNSYLLSCIQPDRFNVLTIHAEAEGISCKGLFSDFLVQAEKQNIRFQPLKKLLQNSSTDLPSAAIIQKTIKGREGWLSCQDAKEL